MITFTDHLFQIKLWNNDRLIAVRNYEHDENPEQIISEWIKELNI